jgi:radical SAM superfamily enzyme YgiQ (UPF0313 family)
MQAMKILLVKPKARLVTINSLTGLIFLEPLELGYVAAAVPEHHDVRVLDLRLARRPHKIFEKALTNDRPDVVGISGYTHEAMQVVGLAGFVKARLPEAKVVVGGHHATVLPETFDVPAVDAIVRGEGTAPFRAIVEALEADRPLTGIPNVEVPGERSHGSTGELPIHPDLDSIPDPRRDLWDPNDYTTAWTTEEHPPGNTIFPPVAMVRTSYGCRMECSFCVVPKLCRRKHMVRSPDRVAEELARASPEHIYLCDDETFINPGHADALAEAIAKKGVKKRYYAWARSTTVLRHPELFEKWKAIGLDVVFLGFEATTDEELEKVSKHAKVADNQRAHELLRERKIAVHAGFMVGADFTDEQFRRLHQTMEAMPPAQVTFTVYAPSPCSEAWEEERREGRWICDPYDLHDCMHPLVPTAVPLKRFYRELASLVWASGRKNPLRWVGPKIPIRDVLRVFFATWRYTRALKRAYKDFPKGVR